jgi:predicted dehydrogenase
MIDVCVIGFGYWGPNLCRNFVNAPGYNLKSICDNNKLNLQKAKKNYPSTSIYLNFNEAINKNNYDLVVLATPTSTHFKIASLILKKKINILVEKPLCLNLNDHIKLNKIAKKNNVKIFVDFPFIFSGSVQYIKNIIKKNIYGNLKSIESYREQAPVRKDTSVLWDLSIHDISIINFLLYPNHNKIVSVLKYNRTKNYNKVLINIKNKNIDILIKNNWNSPTKIRLIKFVFDNAVIYYDENENLYKIKIYKKYMDKFNKHTLTIPNIDLSEPLFNLAKHIQRNLNKRNKLSDDNFNLSITNFMTKLDNF